jgi:Ca2+-binding EF-hand superfamily protein
VFQVSSLQYSKLDFEEFSAVAISVHQLEGMDCWEQNVRRAYELFEKDGNRPIMFEELASVCSLSLTHTHTHTHTHTRGFAHSGRARNSTWGTVKYTKMKRPLRYVMDGF